MIYINGVAQVGVGDMTKAVYDPDLDGKIALAQLVDAVCSEAEAAALIAAYSTKVTSGTYNGDDAANRAIAHGLGVVPSVVVIVQVNATNSGFVAGARCINAFMDNSDSVTAWDATNFYVGDTSSQLNGTGDVYNWVACA